MKEQKIKLNNKIVIQFYIIKIIIGFLSTKILKKNKILYDKKISFIKLN